MKREQLELIVPQLPKYRAFFKFFDAELSGALFGASWDSQMNIGPVVNFNDKHSSHFK